MLTVALIGADGAGKTTISHQLLDSFPLPMKYIYMGMNIESGNVVLPTSRLIFYLKVHLHKRALKKAGKTLPKKVSFHTIGHRRVDRGGMWVVARLVNRIAEESYRHFVAWTYKQRKNIVLYDRLAAFDLTSIDDDLPKKTKRRTDRIHLWFLNHVYPQPDLVIFLDAPPEVLYARKQEVPVDYLRDRRQAIMAKGATMPNFIQVDASQPLEAVYEEVANHIMQAATAGGKRPLTSQNPSH